VDGRRPQAGTIASIPTFESYAANFHHHVHAIITEGVFLLGADGVHGSVGRHGVLGPKGR
jgi:hypothetical protein